MIEVRIRKFYKMADNSEKLDIVPAVSYLCPDTGPVGPEGFFAKAAEALGKGAAELAEDIDMVSEEMTEDEIKQYRKDEDDEED